MKKGIAIVVALLVILSFGCKNTANNIITMMPNDPAQAESYQLMADEYQLSTGIQVDIVTDIAKKPTIFPVNQNDFNKEGAMNLKEASIYQNLWTKDVAYADENGVYAVPMSVEVYGLIFNNTIMQRYLGMANKQVPISTVEEINSIDILSAVVEDMTINKEILGIDAVFAPLPLESGGEGIQAFYDAHKNADQAQVQKVLDLYTKNSTIPYQDGQKVGDTEALTQFAQRRVAMIAGSTAMMQRLKAIPNNYVMAEDLGILPLLLDQKEVYIRPIHFVAIDANATAEQKNAATDFLNWMVSNATGKGFISDVFNYTPPFVTFKEYTGKDSFVGQTLYWLDKGKIVVVNPKEGEYGTFLNSLGEYVAGNATYDKIA